MFLSKLVCTDDEKKSVYELRYKISINELRQNIIDVNHEERIIVTPRDINGYLFATYYNQSLAGTVLCNQGDDQGLKESFYIYKLDTLSMEQLKKTYLVTMLLFLKEHQGKDGAIQLLKYIFRYHLDRGFEKVVMACFPWLEDSFTLLGFERVAIINHPCFGEIPLMHLRANDYNYLAGKGSMFAGCFPKNKLFYN